MKNLLPGHFIISPLGQLPTFCNIELKSSNNNSQIPLSTSISTTPPSRGSSSNTQDLLQNLHQILLHTMLEVLMLLPKGKSGKTTVLTTISQLHVLLKLKSHPKQNFLSATIIYLPTTGQILKVQL